MSCPPAPAAASLAAPDVEETFPATEPLRQRRPIANEDAPQTTTIPPPPPGTLPPHHPFNVLQRVLILGAALWGLWEMKVYSKVLHHPRVSHSWFKMGLAASVALLMVKSYLELYEGKMCRQTVDYPHYRQTTHLALALILVSTVSFHAALWSALGGFQTILVMLMMGYGVLLQTMLLVHNAWIQNIGGAVLLTLFLQQYQ